MDNEPRKLKRAIIKEELVAITGDYVKAILLNQLMYWAERVKDFDEYKKQENTIAERHGEKLQEFSYGWIYKTAEDLSSETMLGLAPSNIRKHLRGLIDEGFISQRANPKYKWDRTLQYKVNLAEIAKRLQESGYSLEGYSVLNLPFFVLKNRSGQNENAIPEITTKTTPEITNKENKENKNATALPSDDIDTTSAPNKNRTTNSKEDIDAEFETLWTLYPRKQGKSNAKKAYDKARKGHPEIYKKVEDGIHAYIAYLKANKTEQHFIKQGSTWFNQKCWEDDYTVGGNNNGNAEQDASRENGYNWDNIGINL